MRDDVYMPWGKHSGKHIGDVPRAYLNWLLEQEWLKDDLREIIEDECATRDRSYITE